MAPWKMFYNPAISVIRNTYTGYIVRLKHELSLKTVESLELNFIVIVWGNIMQIVKYL